MPGSPAPRGGERDAALLGRREGGPRGGVRADPGGRGREERTGEGHGRVVATGMAWKEDGLSLSLYRRKETRTE